MRRLIIETDAEDMARVADDPWLVKIELLEVLSFLKEDPKDFVGICRVKFKDLKTHPKELFARTGGYFQILDRSKEGAYTLLFRGKADDEPHTRGFWKIGGYLSTPYEIMDGKVKLTFLGSAREVKSFLEFVQKFGIPYKIDLLTDAKFSRESPLSRLSDKQRKVLSTAFNLGYYDSPKRIDSRELAKRLGIRTPTLVIHRRKAERQILAELFREA